MIYVYYITLGEIVENHLEALRQSICLRLNEAGNLWYELLYSVIESMTLMYIQLQSFTEIHRYIQAGV